MTRVVGLLGATAILLSFLLWGNAEHRPGGGLYAALAILPYCAIVSGLSPQGRKMPFGRLLVLFLLLNVLALVLWFSGIALANLVQIPLHRYAILAVNAFGTMLCYWTARRAAPVWKGGA